MWTILKIFIEFVTILLLLQYCLCFGFLALKHGEFGPKAPWLRMEPPHPVLEEVLTAGLPGKSLSDLWFYY